VVAATRRTRRGVRQRLHGRTVELFEQRAARAGQLAERTPVQCQEQCVDLGIQIAEAEERVMTQARQDPTFDQEHPIFSFGFITRLSGPRRDNRHAVMFGELLVSRIQTGS